MSFIEGLRIELSINSCGVRHRRLARATPFYIVFHGDRHFSHEHFGVHLGQEDHLTFLGDPDRKFFGSFMDCRLGSATYGNRLTILLACDMHKTLVVPAGVAHAFSDLENIFTINNYILYLPDEEALLSGTGDWNIEHDVLNVSLDCPSENVPCVNPNREPASDLLYEILAISHRDNLRGAQKQYPIIQDVMTADRGSMRLKFAPPTASFGDGPNATWATVAGSRLVRWLAQIKVASGSDSGIYVMPHFLATDIIVSPFDSVRSSGVIGSNGFKVTLLSQASIELVAFNKHERETFLIPGDGSFEAHASQGCDISVAHSGVHAIVSAKANSSSSDGISH